MTIVSPTLRRMIMRCVFRRAMAHAQAHRIILFLMLVAIPASAFSQTQLITEQNIGDAILERQEFLPVELDSLDLNRDGVVNIADLTYHMLRVSDLVPSVAFDTRSAKGNESDSTIRLRIVFSKVLESDLTITYSLGGTATHGAKSEGGDYTLPGYDAASETGTLLTTAGDTEAFLEMTVHDDAIFNEGMEMVNISLTGGSSQTYFLGSLQTYTFYIDDNDAIWQAGLEFPEGGGYEHFKLEITQEEGAFSGRVLANDALIPMPEGEDANRAGEDGWVANCYAGSGTLRIEIGPIPMDASVSFFNVHRSRYYVLEFGPGKGDYRYEPNSVLMGVAEQIIEPVDSRLGEPSGAYQYLRRELTGPAMMMKQVSNVVLEEVALQDAE